MFIWIYWALRSLIWQHSAAPEAHTVIFSTDHHITSRHITHGHTNTTPLFSCCFYVISCEPFVSVLHRDVFSFSFFFPCRAFSGSAISALIALCGQWKQINYNLNSWAAICDATVSVNHTIKKRQCTKTQVCVQPPFFFIDHFLIDISTPAHNNICTAAQTPKRSLVVFLFHNRLETLTFAHLISRAGGCIIPKKLCCSVAPLGFPVAYTLFFFLLLHSWSRLEQTMESAPQAH